MIKYVIFDMDGTIADTEPYHKAARDALLESLGIDAKTNSDKAIGKSKTLFYKEMVVEHNLNVDYEKLSNDEFESIMKIIEKSNLGPMEGLVDVLIFLKNRNIKMGVASSSPTNYLNLVLNKIGVYKYFDCVVGADQVENAKPDPDVYLKVIDLLKANKDECIAVEDSKAGAISSISAGIKVIGFDDANVITKQDLSICDYIIHNMKEITNIICNIK